MRHVFIDLSSDNHLQQPQIFAGYEGEHNETILQVKLPERLLNNNYTGYRFDFQTSEDNKIPSPLISSNKLENGILSFGLTEQVTIAGKLLFNIVGILLNGDTVDLVSKTNMIILYIGESPDGKSVLPDPSGYKDEVLEMIDDRIKKAIFVPSVSIAGIISWTNDMGLDNPNPVNIKGNSGVHVGSGEMPEDCNVQIDPDGETIDLTRYLERQEFKAETVNFATKQYVDEEIATFDFIKVVDILPTTGLPNRIYLVPNTYAEEQNLFDEYIWLNKGTEDAPEWVWEFVASKTVEVDLTDYYKKSETKLIINDCWKASYPIGSIWIGGKYEESVIDLDTEELIHAAGEPINPADIFGGKWELIDKEFAPYRKWITDSGEMGNLISSGDDLSVSSIGITRFENEIKLSINGKFNVDISPDSNNSILFQIPESSLNNWGIQYIANNGSIIHPVYHFAYSDDANSIIAFQASDAGGGNIRFTAVEQAPQNNNGIIKSGSSFHMTVSLNFMHYYLLDSFCDKFYWRRIEPTEVTE